MSNLLYSNYTKIQIGNSARVRQDCENKVRGFKKLILSHLPENREALIADCGCGYGAMLVALNRAGYKNALGVDISEDQITTGRSLFGLKNLEVADVFTFLTTDPRKFEGVILLDVLEHIETEKSIELLRLIHNRLVVGGRLIVQVPNGLTPLSPYYYGDITHKRAYAPASLAQSFCLGGFDLFNIYPIHPIPFGFTSFIRSVAWRILIEPLIATMLITIYGGHMGRVYSPNIMGVAVKSSPIDLTINGLVK